MHQKLNKKKREEQKSEEKIRKSYPIKVIDKKIYTLNIKADSLEEAKALAMNTENIHLLVKNPEREREVMSDRQWISQQQSKALHVWFKWYADALQEKGITIKELITELEKKGIETFPNAEYIKENVFKKIAKALGYRSHLLIKQEDFEKIKESFIEVMMRVSGVNIVFPSQEIKSYERDY